LEASGFADHLCIGPAIDFSLALLLFLLKFKEKESIEMSSQYAHDLVNKCLVSQIVLVENLQGVLRTVKPK